MEGTEGLSFNPSVPPPSPLLSYWDGIQDIQVRCSTEHLVRPDVRSHPRIALFCVSCRLDKIRRLCGVNSMLPIFSKPLIEVEASDVLDLIREQHPETDLVEFKEALPCKKGQDNWYSGSDSIGEYARNQLVAEIIAFANAHGGHLLLGVAESHDHPSRAIGTKYVPRCVDLAERLKLQIRDCVEPTIPIVGVRAIEMNGAGDGIVLVRVLQSRVAPHRLRANKECYFRHADRTETMTMRDIQDLTIQRSAAGQHLDKVLADRDLRFQEWIRASSTTNRVSVGCRVSLVPTADIYVQHVYRNHAVLPYLHHFDIEFGSESKLEGQIPSTVHDERPIVRGTRRMDSSQQPSVIQEVHCSGLVEICFRESKEDAKLYDSWILGVFCNGILMADSFRKAAGAPDVEYALEFQVAATTTTVPITSIGRFRQFALLGTPPSSPCLYPRLSLGDFSREHKSLIEIAMTDIWNSCSMPFSKKITMVSWRT